MHQANLNWQNVVYTTFIRFDSCILFRIEMKNVNEEGKLANIFSEIEALDYIKIPGKSDRVFTRHLGGKIETVSRSQISSLEELQDIYTPGVARVCLAIQKNPALAMKCTSIKKRVAIVTDDTAILGLGFQDF